MSWGAVKHLSKVLPFWASASTAIHVELLIPGEVPAELILPGIEIVHVAKADYRKGFRDLGKAASTRGFDVVFLALPRPVPISPDIPVVALLQNIEPFQRPGYPMPIWWRLRLWMLRREQLQALSRASRIVAISEHVRRTLSSEKRLAGIPMDLVYHGVSHSDIRQSSHPTNAPGGSFLFAAGSLVPYRGFEDIIRALGALEREGITTPALFLTGRNDDESWYARRLRNLVKELNFSDRVIWAGHLSQLEMNWAYHNCKMFLQSSRAEACPNIVIEALAHGCKIISCDNPPMPELLKDKALYYEVGNHEHLAMILKKCLLDGDSFMTPSPGCRDGKTFPYDWDTTAELTLHALRLACHSS